VLEACRKLENSVMCFFSCPIDGLLFLELSFELVLFCKLSELSFL
jgi:hypothetical protein